MLMDGDGVEHGNQVQASLVAGWYSRLLVIVYFFTNQGEACFQRNSYPKPVLPVSIQTVLLWLSG